MKSPLHLAFQAREGCRTLSVVRCCCCNDGHWEENPPPSRISSEGGGSRGVSRVIVSIMVPKRLPGARDADASRAPIVVVMFLPSMGRRGHFLSYINVKI
jgi:hypothetical protein